MQVVKAELDQRLAVADLKDTFARIAQRADQARVQQQHQAEQRQQEAEQQQRTTQQQQRADLDQWDRERQGLLLQTRSLAQDKQVCCGSCPPDWCICSVGVCQSHQGFDFVLSNAMHAAVLLAQAKMAR